MQTKKCTGCGIEKELTEFSKTKGGKYGVRSKCKICGTAYTKQWIAKHPEQAKQSHRQWLKDNKQKVRLKTKEYWRKHRDKKAEKDKRYREKYPDKIRDKKKIYAKNNPDIINESGRRYKRRYPHKVKCRSTFNNAITQGLIQRLPCSICNNPKSEGHHPNYDKPLDVIWL